jgi:activator of 2-hydroxyglutaryl-CoA dehydratase
MALIMGMDIGSGTSKGVIVRDGKPVVYHLLPSGVDYRAVALKLRDESLTKAGLSESDIADTIATGHGAGNVAFSRLQESDILCCARGITSIFPSVRTIIDVQRTFTQVIRLNATGHVINFVINEKCATGSGCFLDIISHVLQIDLKDAGLLSGRITRLSLQPGVPFLENRKPFRGSPKALPRKIFWPAFIRPWPVKYPHLLSGSASKWTAP